MADDRVPDDPAGVPRRRWLLDEKASAGRENLDPDHIARYDDKEDADAEAEVRLLATRGLGRESVVVDLGAGTGQFTLAAAPMCSRVIAVDISPVMLQLLASKVRTQGLSNVELVNAGFLTYVHEGPPADVVYTRFALHHLPDFWKAVALDRVHGLLRSGGVLRLLDVVYSFELGAAEELIEAWCSTGGPDMESGWARDELEEHVRTEHSTFSWLLEPMLARTGFEVEDVAYSADGILARYVARAT